LAVEEAHLGQEVMHADGDSQAIAGCRIASPDDLVILVGAREERRVRRPPGPGAASLTVARCASMTRLPVVTDLDRVASRPEARGARPGTCRRPGRKPDRRSDARPPAALTDLAAPEARLGLVSIAAALGLPAR
jgi:hypothetical protein